ncbi:hypothetical protein KP004_06230 [Geomonas oryzisoli]|uniref:Uncharacterized protein n=1 Tax=Geomonas oryzisoli TaxID=2847992 RepID=A0ABX8J8W2_9BACT|nr:hypothetical protein [Geomonas oryzisoli]QWV94773.1 hypothetical protein KP004_06230 [Geomonas oryzisoli]
MQKRPFLLFVAGETVGRFAVVAVAVPAAAAAASSLLVIVLRHCAF